MPGMVREAQNPMRDNIPLSEIPMEAMDVGTVEKYRREYRLENPKSELNDLPDERFLEIMGAAGASEGVLHPTAAGALMFCSSLYTTRVFPNYFLDYKEYGLGGPDWTDRISSMRPGECDNLFEFFTRVSERIWRNLPEPLEFDRSMIRVEDNSLRKAAREFLMNALMHADYAGETGVAVDMRPGSLTIANPGLFRIPVGRAVSGGISSTRNPTLFRMFGLIGRSERAGTGVYRSIAALKSAGFHAPEIIQEHKPSRTVVSIDLRIANPGGLQSEIIRLISQNGAITIDEIAESTGVDRNKVYANMRALMDSGRISRKGTNRKGTWIINDRSGRISSTTMSSKNMCFLPMTSHFIPPINDPMASRSVRDDATTTSLPPGSKCSPAPSRSLGNGPRPSAPPDHAFSRSPSSSTGR